MVRPGAQAPSRAIVGQKMEQDAAEGGEGIVALQERCANLTHELREARRELSSLQGSLCRARASGAASEELTSMHRAIVEKAGALAKVTSENVSLQQHLEAERQRSNIIPIALTDYHDNRLSVKPHAAQQ